MTIKSFVVFLLWIYKLLKWYWMLLHFPWVVLSFTYCLFTEQVLSCLSLFFLCFDKFPSWKKVKYTESTVGNKDRKGLFIKWIIINHCLSDWDNCTIDYLTINFIIHTYFHVQRIFHWRIPSYTSHIPILVT